MYKEINHITVKDENGRQKMSVDLGINNKVYDYLQSGIEIGK